jgi:hypothetical protein
MEVAVSVADELPEDEGRLIVDQEWLVGAVESILKGDAGAPETLAQMFISFRDAIRSGLRGMNQLDEALVATIEVIYLRQGRMWPRSSCMCWRRRGICGWRMSR